MKIGCQIRYHILLACSYALSRVTDGRFLDRPRESIAIGNNDLYSYFLMENFQENLEELTDFKSEKNGQCRY